MFHSRKGGRAKAVTIQAAVAQAVADYQTWQRAIGRDINPSKLVAMVMEAGAKRVMPLKVSGPFHTPLMAPAGNALREYFQGVAFADPQIPVIFNCLGDVKDDSTPIQELLVKQVQSSVFMEDSIRKMADMGVDAIVEIGPGKALSGFVKKTVPGIPVCAVETAADVENLPDTLEQLIKEKA